MDEKWRKKEHDYVEWEGGRTWKFREKDEWWVYNPETLKIELTELGKSIPEVVESYNEYLKQ